MVEPTPVGLGAHSKSRSAETALFLGQQILGNAMMSLQARTLALFDGFHVLTPAVVYAGPQEIKSFDDRVKQDRLIADLHGRGLSTAARSLYRPDKAESRLVLVTGAEKTEFAALFTLKSVQNAGIDRALRVVGDRFDRNPEPARAVFGWFEQGAPLPSKEGVLELARELPGQTSVTRVGFFPVEPPPAYLATVTAMAAQHRG